MQVNKKFEGNISLEYYHMTYIGKTKHTISSGLLGNRPVLYRLDTSSKETEICMHNVYLNSPFVVMSDSKLKFESLSGYDRCFRYLTILRAP